MPVIQQETITTEALVAARPAHDGTTLSPTVKRILTGLGWCGFVGAVVAGSDVPSLGWPGLVLTVAMSAVSAQASRIRNAHWPRQPISRATLWFLVLFNGPIAALAAAGIGPHGAEQRSLISVAMGGIAGLAAVGIVRQRRAVR